MRGKWAGGIVPRSFTWIIKDRIAISERPGGCGDVHRRVRRQEEINQLSLYIREIGLIVKQIPKNEKHIRFEAEKLLLTNQIHHLQKQLGSMAHMSTVSIKLLQSPRRQQENTDFQSQKDLHIQQLTRYLPASSEQLITSSNLNTERQHLERQETPVKMGLATFANSGQSSSKSVKMTSPRSAYSQHSSLLYNPPIRHSLSKFKFISSLSDRRPLAAQSFSVSAKKPPVV